MLKLFFLLALVSCACITIIESLHFSFPSFDPKNSSQLTYGNDFSTIAYGAIQVTLDVNGANMANRAGRAVFSQKFKVWKQKGKNTPFNSTFDITIVNQTSPGGEGLAFILTADPKVPPGSDGQWLGIVSPDLNGSAQAQTVAIEFDTRKSFPSDLDDNHIALDINSVYSAKQIPLRLFNLSTSSGVKTHVDVAYDGRNLSVTVSNNVTRLTMIFSEEIDLSNYLPKEVYVGFSASTSSLTQLNCVNSWSFDADDEDKKKLAWVVGVAISLGIVLIVSAGLFVWWRMRYSNRGNEDDDVIEVEIRSWSIAPTRYKYKELSKATNNFSQSNFIGEGGFAKVYKGVLNGDTVAVKKITNEKAQGKREFIAEVSTIGNMNHRNLLKLNGWCCESSGYLLVYEYMPNGSLEKFIDHEKDHLSWKMSIDVLSGVAQAVAYLHGGCGKTVLHRDIKPSNIMLDSDFKGKLGDFGLARTMKDNKDTHHSTLEMAGTPGYIAPEFQFTRWSTAQTDVYSFGVVILELACGKRRTVNARENDIVNWVWDLYGKGRIIEAADTRLRGDFNEEEMKSFLMLGLACCHPNPYERPPMNAVVQVLSGEAPVPEVQKDRPRFVWPVMLSMESDFSMVVSQLEPISIIDGR